VSFIYVPNTTRRLFARLIDQLITLIFYIPIAKAAMLLILTDQEVEISVYLLILMGLIPAIYEGMWLWLMQQTPGKWFLGLKVVSSDDPDRPLDWQQCVMRALVGRLDLFVSLAVYATAFFRYDRTHLADWLAETRVVQEKPRLKPAQCRWILGSLFVLIYSLQGLEQAAHFLKNASVHDGKISLRKIYETPQLSLEDDERAED
jgi:uncharacterized RDD family membrane protein YckC